MTGSNSFEFEAVQSRLLDQYDGHVFRLASTQWAEILAEHFRRLQSRNEPVLNWGEPEQNIELAAAQLASGRALSLATDSWLEEFAALLRTMLQHGQNLHHPRYLGHQVPASMPIAALFDAIGSATNQVMAIYEMGPWATAVERAMIDQLGQQIGYPRGSFAGLVTSGGSLANLTALLTARNVTLGEVWSRGIQDSGKLAILVQADAHYCISRAAGVLGIGTQQIVKNSPR